MTTDTGQVLTEFLQTLYRLTIDIFLVCGSLVTRPDPLVFYNQPTERKSAMAQRNNLPAAERLIVAADFSGADGRIIVRDKVLWLADQLVDTGVILKANSALRAIGYDLIDELHARGLKVFADLKLNDIKNTMTNDGHLLREASPYIVTAMCSMGKAGLQALKLQLPDTEVLGVTTLTNLTDADTEAMFSCSTAEATLRFANQAVDAADGLISSPAELAELSKRYELVFSFNTPGIRPAWKQKVDGDDQNAKRVMTPANAIKAGADRIVVGRPITQVPNPLDAVRRTLDEIDEALA